MAKKAREAKARAKPQVKAAKAPAGAVLGKTPREYYEAIKLPLAVLVVWSVIGFLTALAVPPLVFITALVSLILALATGLYVGWTMVKRERGGLPQALVAGAALGVIASAVGRALDVILSLMQAGALGAGVAVVAAIIGIVAGGIIEAALAAIGALAAKYV